MKKRLSWPYLMVLTCFFTIYIFPSYYFETKGIPVTGIITGGFLVYSFFNIMKYKRMSLIEVFYLLLIILCCIFQRSISPLVLLAPLVVNKIFNDYIVDEIKKILIYSYLPYIALAATIIYSIVYGIQSGRYLHVGVYEVNSSSLAALILGLIFYKRRKYFGIVILFAGCLSLSRNYFLALGIMIVFEIIIRKRNFFNINFTKLFDFRIIVILSSLVLYILGLVCEKMYTAGLIVAESGIKGRIRNLFDVSNYFRFTTNVFLIRVFFENPLFWVVGCRTDEFRELCYAYAWRHGQWYRGNNPHNFFFSYVKLYGLAGIMDVFFVGNLLKSIVNNKNLAIYLAIVCYSVFLSVSFNGIWLFLSISVLYLYA